MAQKETPWFYQPDLSVDTLLPAEARHAASVLRLREGAPICLTTGEGQTAEAEIARIHKGEVWIRLKEVTDAPPRAFEKALLVGQMHQADRLEWLVEKVQELGLSRLIICKMDRSAPAKLSEDRLYRIALSALKQSHQAWLLRLTFCQKIEEALALCPQPAGFGYLPQGDEIVASAFRYAPNLQTLVIGPEADFSDREVSFLLEKGTLPISLGPSRLRTETAALAAAVFLQLC